MRVDSPTYGEWTSVELTPENGRALYVPRGFAHGFVALKDNTYFEYIVDNVYNKESEFGIRYDDPEINIDWKIPANKEKKRKKDRLANTLKDLKQKTR